jgi:hypothetical protein
MECACGHDQPDWPDAATEQAERDCCPAALGRDLQAVIALPVDGEPVHPPIERDPEVDGGPGLRFSHVYEGNRVMCSCVGTRMRGVMTGRFVL